MKTYLTKLLRRVYSYSKFVYYFKIACIFIAAMLTLLLILIPIIRPSNKQVSLTPLDITDGKVDINKNTLLKILKPKLYGATSQYGPYRILAEKVSQTKTHLMLYFPNVYFSSSKKDVININSKEGVINSSNKQLKLNGDVKVKHAKGYILTTQEIYFDFNLSKLFTNSEVVILSEKSFLKSQKGFDSFIAESKGIFHGDIYSEYYFDDKEKPIKISSKLLEIENKASTAKLIGEVKLESEGLTINADHLLADYSKGKENTKVFLNGNIKMDTKEEKIIATEGVFELKSNILTLSNNVKIFRANSVAEGEQFIYSFKTKKGELKSKKLNNKNRVKSKIILD